MTAFINKFLKDMNAAQGAVIPNNGMLFVNGPYAGIVPSTYASGGTVRHGRITKTGSSWLRYVLIEAAHHQLHCTKRKGLADYYNGIKERKGGKAAAVATARKLCAVIFRVLTDKQPFVSPEEWDNRRAHHFGIATQR